MNNLLQHPPIPELKDTDLCVLCGMCLPHCPTYAIYQHEAESPRGRISLIQAYAKGILDIDDTAFRHLDHCLGCMACEAMCPSRVPYGHLLQQAKYHLKHKPPSFVLRQLLKAYASPKGIQWIQRTSHVLNWSGITSIGKRLTGSVHATSQIATQSESVKLQSSHVAMATSGSVLLFTGCMGQPYDAQTLQSSIKLLNYFGFNVDIAEHQHCCGALHANNGQAEIARQLERSNCAIFEAIPSKPVVFTSNGCGAHLKNYRTSAQIEDIATFLLHHTSINASDFRSLDAAIMIHESCSSQNKLKITGASAKLLSLIPAIRLVSFNKPSMCCGAGGGHLISYPDLARQLLVEKIHQLKASNVKYLASDNLGCSLHYKTALAEQGLPIEVIHPVTLLAMQLKI